MKKAIFISLILCYFPNLIIAQNLKQPNIVFDQQKLEEFNVTILKGEKTIDVEINEGIILLYQIGKTKPLTYKVDVDFANVENINDIISFEDFNFDGEKEIVIHAYNAGVYIYDRKTGNEKNLFKETVGYGKGNNSETVKNFINLTRGEYEFSEGNLIITTGCGVYCGTERTYKSDGNGALVVIRECIWEDSE